MTNPPVGARLIPESDLPDWVQAKLTLARAGKVNVTLKLVTWDINSNSPPPIELFLSFSEGRTNNPIQRNGTESPFMFQDGIWNDYMTDPEVQWADSWFVTEDSKRTEIVKGLAQLVHVYHTIHTIDKGFVRGAFWNSIIELLPSESPFADPAFNTFLADTRHIIIGNSIVIKKWGILPSSLAYVSKCLSSHCKPLPMAASVITFDALRHMGRIEAKELKKWIFLLNSYHYSQAHFSIFNDWCKKNHRKIAGHQGCGDLSLNMFHVAFIAEEIIGDKPPFTIILPEEDVNNHDYYCLTKWKEGRSPGGRRTEFAKMRFRRRYGDAPVESLVLRSAADGKWVEAGSEILFAVSGKPIVWGGVAQQLKDTIGMFTDLRHVFEFPNLNPTVTDGLRDFHDHNLRHRPRSAFDRLQWDDVWLGEAALLDSRELRKATLTGSIGLTPSDLGTFEEHIEAALKGRGEMPQHYAQVESLNIDLVPGQFRKDKRGRETVFEMRFRRNTYPYSIMGMTKEGHLLSCVWQGPYSDQEHGFTIEEMANLLVEMKVESALLFEEGADPYLDVIDLPEWSIPLKRGKRPAVFFMVSRTP